MRAWACFGIVGALAGCTGQVIDAGSNKDAGSGGGQPSSSGSGQTGNQTGGCNSAPVSFSADVMPIFQQSCTISSVCHGQMGNIGEENLFLDENGGGTPPATIHDLLVGVRSQEDPLMNLVTAGDTSNSYLWHKVVGDQNSNPSVARGCATATNLCTDCNASRPCGAQEPYLGEPLSSADPSAFCTLQNWILQGARNN